MTLDYGFLPGAEADLEALLRAWCAWLDDRGLDQLAVFTSPGLPGHDLVTALASEIEPFVVALEAAEPPDVAERGWYIDAASF